ncbi:hypothetical protein FK85_24655 [Halorubrum saccharovorum]|uniref:Uncharacterized protein n=1 Tax=Halorubrum saccharovorum TaxID=2248 RepID=A0A0F8D6L3_9EURY|nr:hypothetical protein FK85_24655 [Halorubrum saccharovorum]
MVRGWREVIWTVRIEQRCQRLVVRAPDIEFEHSSAVEVDIIFYGVFEEPTERFERPEPTRFDIDDGRLPGQFSNAFDVGYRCIPGDAVSVCFQDVSRRIGNFRVLNDYVGERLE